MIPGLTAPCTAVLAVTTTSYSRARPILLVIAAVFAVVAFFASQGFKKRNGVTPWHVPSVVWGLIGFVSLILCAILLAIAAKTTKPTMAPAGVGFPGAPPPPGFWSQDPTGRFQSRYWDGTRWTEHVSDGTITSVDPL